MVGRVHGSVKVTDVVGDLVLDLGELLDVELVSRSAKRSLLIELLEIVLDSTSLDLLLLLRVLHGHLQDVEGSMVESFGR